MAAMAKAIAIAKPNFLLIAGSNMSWQCAKRLMVLYAVQP
jgi:hypothetical protein